MNIKDSRGFALSTPWVQERYGPALLVSIGLHAVVVLLFIFGGQLLPKTVIRIGSGAGGGTGGDVVTTVGVIDELSGGAGMVKPSIVPKPPALQEKASPQKEEKAIPLPGTLEKKKKPDKRDTAKNTKPIPDIRNMIPTPAEPGSGGAGGRSGGSGGGFGGGNGVSIGPGSGGFGDSSYARAVERRIGEGWDKPIGAGHVEIVCSFYINSRGVVSDIKIEKSSGNPNLDRNAERAILLLNSPSNPLPAPPPEFRGRLIQFVAQFIYPPND